MVQFCRVIANGGYPAVSGWQANRAEYPAGFGDQHFDAWAVGFGFALQAQFGHDIGSLSAATFTTAFDAYISMNPPPFGP